MSHVQLLRAIFQALADPRTFAKGLFMQWPEGQNAGALASPPSQQAMQKAFEVVFVDSTGWCNLAAHTSKSALQQVNMACTCSFARCTGIYEAIPKNSTSWCNLAAHVSKSALQQVNMACTCLLAFTRL